MKQDLDIKVSPTLEHAALICETEERENMPASEISENDLNYTVRMD